MEAYHCYAKHRDLPHSSHNMFFYFCTTISSG